MLIDRNEGALLMLIDRNEELDMVVIEAALAKRLCRYPRAIALAVELVLAARPAGATSENRLKVYVRKRALAKRMWQSYRARWSITCLRSTLIRLTNLGVLRFNPPGKPGADGPYEFL